MSDFWAQVATLARSLERRSYYALLEITDEANADDVRAAYARLIAAYHPDRHARETDAERRRALVSIQARLNEAYRALIDPVKRAAYDRGLVEGKVRLADGPAVARTASISLVSPRARTFFDAGQECERAGDLAAARMQYGLAIQVDPESIPIREAIARLSAPAAAPPPPEPSPAPAPARHAPPQSDFVREDTRHPFARPVKLRCTSWEQVITLHARNLSRGGIFVRTASPLELGTLLDVQLALPDGRTLTLEAEVARVVAPERDGDEPSGMALRFLPMDDERKAAFDEALADAAARAGRSAPTTARPSARAASSDPIEEATLREVLADVARMREARRHEILGVPPDADVATIRLAFVRLAKRHHPDLFVRYRSPLVVDAAIDAFAIVCQAYEHLGAEAEARASTSPAVAVDAGTPARPLLAEDLFSDRVDTRSSAPAAAPRSAAQLAAEGRAALVAGRHAEARALLDEATRLEPRDRMLRALFHLASGYEAKASGRAREALDHFETALVFDKACEEAIRELRAAAARGGTRS